MTVTTAGGPTGRSVAWAARGPVAVVVGLALVVGLVTLLVGTRRTGSLDPRAYDPAGAHALAQVLRDRGVQVDVIGGVGEVSADTLVVLAFPDAMSKADLGLVGSYTSPIVVVAPDSDSLSALDVHAEAVAGFGTSSLEPGCELAVALDAGSARMGGEGFLGDGAGCYLSDGLPSLYREGHATVVGSGDFLRNKHLDEDGNAALAVGLLGQADHVQWLMPRAGASSGEKRGLLSLLPTWFVAAVAQLCVAVVVLALWRARRLGRVVPEPLPVLVRAAEAVEGRGRLYRSARARDRAADALRASSRDAATRRLGLGASAEPPALVAAVADRTGQAAADVEVLLYGPVPVDDAALLRLADALARLDSEVSAS